MDLAQQREKLIADFAAKKQKYLFWGLILILIFLMVIYFGPFKGLERFGPLVQKKEEEQPTRAASLTIEQSKFPYRNWGYFLDTSKISPANAVPKLSAYDFIVVDADANANDWTSSQISQIKANIAPRGGKIISYLDIGSCENWRSYWSQCSQYAVGNYQGYADEKWMDVTNPAYRDLVVNTLSQSLVNMGVDGFYYDNIDIYQEAVSGNLSKNGVKLSTKDVKQGVADIMRRLRQKYPDLFLVAQNGIYNTDQSVNGDNVLYFPDANNANTPVYAYANAEGHEDTNSYSASMKALVFSALADLKSKGKPIFLIDYPSSANTAKAYAQDTNCHGFLPLETSVNLNVINIYPDTSLPATPSGLIGVAAANGVNLSWNSATCTNPGDDYAVTSYKIYRDGTLIAQRYMVDSNLPLNSLADTSAPQTGTYTYTVSAVDLGGNESAKSAPVIVDYSGNVTSSPSTTTPISTTAPTPTRTSTPTLTPTPIPTLTSTPRPTPSASTPTTVNPPKNLYTTNSSIKWSSSSTSSVSYNVYQTKLKLQGPCSANHPAPTLYKTGLTQTSYFYQATDKTPGYTYWYYATAVKNGVESSPSNQDCSWF